MSKWIKKLTEAYSEVNEKKKMDPVGQADADIDNDGDVDKSDKYLHNRRKAIGKAMKDTDESAKAGLAKKLAKASQSSEKGKKAVSLKPMPDSLKKKMDEEEVIMNPKKDKDKKAEAETMATEAVEESSIPPVYARILEKRREHYKGATPPEGAHDKEKASKGAMDMHNTPKDIKDNPEASGDEVRKAGQAGPSPKMRSGDNMKGDKKVIPSATPMKG